MNGLRAQLAELRALSDALARRPAAGRVGVCPPATLIHRAAEVLSGSRVDLGAQDCRAEAAGAFTGDLSAEMLADAGARLVILGHSERRRGHGESNTLIAGKVAASLRAGLEPIICVGERLEERRAGETRTVVLAQVRGSLPIELARRAFMIAYEPVWAIGSGLTPSLAEIEEAHAAIRGELLARLGSEGERAPILYGGSVKPGNAAAVLAVAEVGGALVGGASLKASDFLGIIHPES